MWWDEYLWGCIWLQYKPRGPYSIHFMNQASQADENLIKGHIWPAGRTLDMPVLECTGLTDRYKVSDVKEKATAFACKARFYQLYIISPNHS